jgi:hypothetical protein
LNQTPYEGVMNLQNNSLGEFQDSSICESWKFTSFQSNPHCHLQNILQRKKMVILFKSKPRWGIVNVFFLQLCQFGSN